ncbi:MULTISPECIES: aspartate 1-decarboxylase [Oligella]|uniref:Aspartate 1-decarboxylase n=3 Tax=Oligella urethralis TaxID=90245 RepID=A0A095ZBU1_9BURK|nr:MULTISPECIES: aspartate 1-decarboxylase [Oligella]AVL70352.1 aspartate 1-decarboxylase [Oligella urethralis]KGF32138.1 aspartate decarboxylase [Oligella urethralis DNF00040]MDK6203153.1 aspartate 1-decarboxylase [Oligella urethralis]OFS83938.1 aspartate 1-decarboxylase [Oligella sp. HMSC05A10]OFV49161.1 aspartate 1-decarboxylase [Oligella sp. HMSC09E12]
MMRIMMNSKIHRAVVTEADLNYIGSVTIDRDIMDAVGLLANEKVAIVNNNNGARLETYVIEGERGSRVICLNGAAARLVQKGDVVIIMSYVYVTDEEAKNHRPKVAIMNPDNTIQEILDYEAEATIR